MSTSGEHEPSPYREMPEAMRAALSDPSVNADEHISYFPRLLTLLPSRGLPFTEGRVRRVLDYGCGPGNFTMELARLYPRANVVGTDAVPEMLPTSGGNLRNVTFQEWDGQTTLGEDRFDLIVAKLVLHYLSPADLRLVVPNLASALTPGGSLVASVPHSADSRRFVNPGEDGRAPSAQIRRQVGKTGIVASMWHYDHWVASILRLMPDEYVVVRDELRNSEGEPKRLNFLFCPRGDRLISALRKLRRLGLSSESSKEAAAITEILSDDLRAAANYYAEHGGL